MKNGIYYLFMIGICTIVSCNKEILDQSPNSQVASATMWTTTGLTDQGVNGVYQTLRSGGAGNLYPLYELYSMDRYSSIGQDYDNIHNDNFVKSSVTTSDGYIRGTWQLFYEGIKRANDAITNIPAVSPYDEDTKRRYVAECKILRAYFYFRLAQLFHDVPIYTENPSDVVAGYNKPASPRDDVWLQCANDLTDAINESKLPAFYAQTAAGAGRVTKGTAYALRGQVYMWQQKWGQAIADFQQVQNAGYQLYTGAGENSYKMLFKQAQNNCPEMIFSMQNANIGTSASNGYGGTSVYYCAPRSWAGLGWSWLTPSNDLVDSYQNMDGSTFSWDAVIPGYSAMTPDQRQVYFLRNNATAAELATAASAGADVSKYDPANNEARILQVYNNRDPRLKQSVITPYSDYLGCVSLTQPQTYTWRWPYRSDVAPTFDIKSDRTAYGMYFYKKFVYEGTSEGSFRDVVPINYPIIRYADVLLQWAEAINESQGPTQQALDLINQVRQRAKMPNLVLAGGGSNPNVVQGQVDLRNRIINERKVEFSNEGVIYFDELRWGTWKQNKFYAGNGAKSVWGVVFAGAAYSWQGDYITRWPVPASVVQISNGVVAKTPGWIY